MKRFLLVCALVASPGSARNYHNSNNAFVTGVIVGAVIAGPPTPFVINTGPVGALVPSGGVGISQASFPVADEIAKMAVLRDKGVLTEAEFQQQKTKLLGGPK